MYVTMMCDAVGAQRVQQNTSGATLCNTEFTKIIPVFNLVSNRSSTYVLQRLGIWRFIKFSMMSATLKIIIFQLSLLFKKSTQTLPNFSLDSNCLLLAGLAIHENSSNLSLLDFHRYYGENLAFSNKRRIPVKFVLPSYTRNKDEFPSWRQNCFQIVLFEDNPTYYGKYFDELLNWGNRNNVVIYLALSITRFESLIRSNLRNLLCTMPSPVYTIILHRSKIDSRLVIRTTMLSPTKGFKNWRHFPSGRGKLFPSPEKLTSLRRGLDYSQDMFRMPLNPDWIRVFGMVNCENHREFIRERTICFNAYAPLQLVSRKLNFTFSEIR